MSTATAQDGGAPSPECLFPPPTPKRPPCTVVTGRPTAVELIHNTYVARQIIKMQDDETYVLCAVGKLIKRYNIIIISNDENFFTDAVRHTVHKTSSSAVAFVIGVKLKLNEKNPTTINTYLRENEIFAAHKGQGRRRQCTIIICN
ncbi:unnamed protein product [Aphis gossypii]|uniref:Uncharacterized protein n=1 Tax=Aphis gossypii TaxID=80765 RepID=A0A9P0NBH9_APHGO|nr:unnamed protein product [Aphis gossypii]